MQVQKQYLEFSNVVKKGFEQLVLIFGYFPHTQLTPSQYEIILS